MSVPVKDPEQIARAVIELLATTRGSDARAVMRGHPAILHSKDACYVLRLLRLKFAGDQGAQEYLRLWEDSLTWHRWAGPLGFLIRRYPCDVVRPSPDLDGWLRHTHSRDELRLLGGHATTIGRVLAGELARDAMLVTTTPDAFSSAGVGLAESLRVGRTAIFCGAGVSFHSGLPLVPELLGFILSRLGAQAADAKLLLDSGLPFESFIEILTEGKGPVERLLSVFELGEPCTTHRWIAKLARKGLVTRICTTNFDRLLERAFEEEGLRRGHEYLVLERDVELQHVDWDDTRILLVKIHGGVDAMEDMAITLRQVAGKALVQSRQDAVRQFFADGSHEQVLLLGYSCSDVFDISPHIETVSGPRKRIAFIDHAMDLDDRESGCVSDVRERETKNPFKQYSGSRIACDTDLLVRWLWAELLEEPYLPNPTRGSASPWRDRVDGWLNEHARRFTPAGVAMTVGALLSAVSRPDRAGHYQHQALKLALELGYEEAVSSAAIDLTFTLMALGRTAEARSCLDQAFKHAERSEGGASSELLNARGIYCKHAGDFAGAIDYFKLSLAELEKSGSEEPVTARGKILANLASAYRQIEGYENASDCVTQALELAREHGDAMGEANFLAALANIRHDQGQFEQAVAVGVQSVELARKLGHRSGEAGGLAGVGYALLEAGRLGEAIERLEQAIRLARAVGDVQTLGNALCVLGAAQLRLNDSDGAEASVDEAVALARSTNNPRLLNRALGNRVLVHYKRGQLEQALSTQQEAHQLAVKLGDHVSIRKHLNNLARIHRDLGNIETVGELAREAMALDDRGLHETPDEAWIRRYGKSSDV